MNLFLILMSIWALVLLIAILTCWREIVMLRFTLKLNKEIGKDIKRAELKVALMERLLQEERTEKAIQLTDEIKRQIDLIRKAQEDLDQLTSLPLSKSVIHCWKPLRKLITFSPELMYYQKKRENENIKK